MTPGAITTEQALRAVADDVGDLLDGQGRVVVGVTGPPGVGKSTFARRVATHLGAAYVPMDGFHLATAQLDRLGRRDRKGAPDTFDVDGYLAALDRIHTAHRESDVYLPDFDRALEEPVAAALVVTADATVVVTEGNYLALWDGARRRLDRLYYLDAPTGRRRERLIARHVAGGRSEAAAANWVDTVDEPNAERIAATRDRCDRTLVITDD